jgi:hypothetical protein
VPTPRTERRLRIYSALEGIADLNGQEKGEGAEFLMLRPLVISLLVFSAILLVAQQPAATAPKSEAGRQAGSLPNDREIVAAAIRGSYYHPDAMSGVDCTIAVDWPAFFTALKLNAAADRLKAIQKLKIQSHAARGKTPELTFAWNNGVLDNKEQFEDGLKQMLGGFYQMYWNLVASSPIDNAAEIAKIEPVPGGGAKIYIAGQNIDVVITTDKENTPTHYTLKSPAMNGTTDLHYVSSPRPVPGDLRRISSMDASEQIGNSILNINLSLDYQTVDGFYIPSHVSFSLAGAYSVSMDFSGCSVFKEAVGH